MPFLHSTLFLSTLQSVSLLICGPCFAWWQKQRIYPCLYNNIVFYYYFKYTLCATSRNTIASLIVESITKIHVHLTIANPQFRWCTRVFRLIVFLQWFVFSNCATAERNIIHQQLIASFGNFQFKASLSTVQLIKLQAKFSYILLLSQKRKSTPLSDRTSFYFISFYIILFFFYFKKVRFIEPKVGATAKVDYRRVQGLSAYGDQLKVLQERS